MYPQSMLRAKIRKLSQISSENNHFSAVKYYRILHGCVFVMLVSDADVRRCREQAGYFSTRQVFRYHNYYNKAPSFLIDSQVKTAV